MMDANVFALLSQTSLPTARKQIKMLNEKNNYIGLNGSSRKLIPTKVALDALGVDVGFHKENETMDEDLESKLKTKERK